MPPTCQHQLPVGTGDCMLALCRGGDSPQLW